jgi:hypothetical protein
VSLKVRCKGNVEGAGFTSGVPGVTIQIAVPGVNVKQNVIGPTDSEGMASGTMYVPGSGQAGADSYRGKTGTFEAKDTSGTWQQVGAFTIN